MAKKRFGVGLMAAILKFKLAAARGRFLSGTRPEMNQHTIKYQIWCFYTNLQDFVHF
jgi:hypothetical protein